MQSQKNAAGSSFVDAQWSALRVSMARVIVPWDVAEPGLNPTTNARARMQLSRAQQCLTAWLQAAKTARVNPDVTFGPDDNYLVTVNGQPRIKAPDVTTYKAAMIAFRSMYVSCISTGGVCSGAPVRIVAAWNEPNAKNGGVNVGVGHLENYVYTPDGSQLLSTVGCPKTPTTNNCGPMLTGQMWNIAYRRLVASPGITITPKVTVIAGEFAGGGGLGKNGRAKGGYLQKYNRYLADLTAPHTRYYPGVWGLHDYEDILKFEIAYHAGKKAPAATIGKGFSHALNALNSKHYTAAKTRIWLDEVSVFYHRALNLEAKANKWGEADQAAAARYLLRAVPAAVGARDPQIGRFYYLRYFDTYKWRALVIGKVTSGNDVSTNPVPAYTTFVNRHKIDHHRAGPPP